MSSNPSVLLIDDGELEDVRTLLYECGADFEHFRGDEIPGEVDDPLDLLVTTSNRAVSLSFKEPSKARGPVRVAVCCDRARAERQDLKAAGFDYMVRRPVHPAALRLLLLRILYQGSEKRQATRFAFGCPVFFRSGFQRRRATLAEVSAGGCRLLTHHPVLPGSEVSIQLPADLVGDTPLNLPAIAIRTEQGEREKGAQGDHSIGFRFETLDAETKRRLRSILVKRYWGPPSMEAEPQAPPEEETKAPASEGEPAHKGAPFPGPQRRHARAAYGGQVVAISPDATRTLVGRDLSIGGMRVESHPKLKVGDRLRIALYASAKEDPLLIHAHVLRDDGELGLALRFETLDVDDQNLLADLLGTLPAIEALGSPDVSPLVLTELVPGSEDSTEDRTLPVDDAERRD